MYNSLDCVTLNLFGVKDPFKNLLKATDPLFLGTCIPHRTCQTSQGLQPPKLIWVPLWTPRQYLRMKEEKLEERRYGSHHTSRAEARGPEPEQQQTDGDAWETLRRGEGTKDPGSESLGRSLQGHAVFPGHKNTSAGAWLLSALHAQRTQVRRRSSPCPALRQAPPPPGPVSSGPNGAGHGTPGAVLAQEQGHLYFPLGLLLSGCGTQVETAHFSASSLHQTKTLHLRSKVSFKSGDLFTEARAPVDPGSCRTRNSLCPSEGESVTPFRKMRVERKEGQTHVPCSTASSSEQRGWPWLCSLLANEADL